jgi:hypothetical protein
MRARRSRNEGQACRRCGTRHRGLTQFHASRLISWSLAPRPVRASTGWTSPTRPRHLLRAMSASPASRFLPPGSAPPKLGFPEPPSQTGLVDVVGHHDGARHHHVAEEGPEEPFPVPGRGEGPWRLTPFGRSPWSTMPSRTRAGLAAWRQVAHHPDECVQSPWGMRCRTMPDRRRTGFPPYRAAATS